MELIDYTGRPDTVTRDRMVERAVDELRERGAKGVLASGHMVAVDFWIGGGLYGNDRSRMTIYTLRLIFGVAHGTLHHILDASMKLSNEGDLKLNIVGMGGMPIISGERFAINAGEVVWNITREPLAVHNAPLVAAEVFHHVEKCLPQVHARLESARY